MCPLNFCRGEAACTSRTHRPKHMQSGHTSVAMKKLKRKAVRDTMANAGQDMKFFFFTLVFVCIYLTEQMVQSKRNDVTCLYVKYVQVEPPSYTQSDEACIAPIHTYVLRRVRNKQWTKL